MQVPENIKLADIEFYKPSSIDMLVGAEFFFNLLENGKIDLGERPYYWSRIIEYQVRVNNSGIDVIVECD